nr:MAG TPA: Rz lysis protein [Caudoviricetes sp.]
MMEKYTRILMVLACIVIGFVSGLTLGRYQLEKTKKEYAEAALQAEQTARAKEQAWQAAHNELQAKYEEEKKNAESKIADLRLRVRSGTVRLSVPARGCAVPGNTTNDAGETRAELDGKTADDLVAIAADGDRAIRDLNQCIDQYRALQ